MINITIKTCPESRQERSDCLEYPAFSSFPYIHLIKHTALIWKSYLEKIFKRLFLRSNEQTKKLKQEGFLSTPTLKCPICGIGFSKMRSKIVISFFLPSLQTCIKDLVLCPLQNQRVTIWQKMDSNTPVIVKGLIPFCGAVFEK